LRRERPGNLQPHTRRKANPPPPRIFLTDRTLLGEALQRRRAARQATDRSCAARAGVSLQTWRRWERGEERPGDEQIARILETLGTTAESFDLEALTIMVERLEPRDRLLHEDPAMADDLKRLLAALKIATQACYTVAKGLDRVLAKTPPSASVRRKAEE
jgi:transcriptional regulator with XRE-family HTH domain